MGRFLWIVGNILWWVVLINYWFAADKLDAIYGLCVAIGLMLISHQYIEDGV